jgi:hypothetical protein
MIIVSFLQESRAKNPIKTNDQNHHKEDKREAQKMCSPHKPKERRELVPLMVGSYLNLQEPKNNCERIGNTPFCDNN